MQQLECIVRDVRTTVELVQRTAQHQRQGVSIADRRRLAKRSVIPLHCVCSALQERPAISGSARNSSTLLYSHPAARAPTIGATQSTHNCARAQPPTNRAGTVLRAGFTDVPVTGMLMRWINVSAKPIAMPAKPTGAR